MNLPAVAWVQLQREDDAHRVRVELQADGWHFLCAERDFRVDARWIDEQRMRADVDGAIIEFAVLHEINSIALAWQGCSYEFQLPVVVHDTDAAAASAGHPRAPMSGAVVAVQVANGHRVESGDPLIVIEAMKMEHTIVAQARATVSEVLYAVGDQVDEGDVLVMLEVE